MINLNECDLYHHGMRVMFNQDRNRLTTGTLDIIKPLLLTELRDVNGRVGFLASTWVCDEFVDPFHRRLEFVDKETGYRREAKYDEVYTVLTPIPYSTF